MGMGLLNGHLLVGLLSGGGRSSRFYHMALMDGSSSFASYVAHSYSWGLPLS